jgi:hypothetical protein
MEQHLDILLSMAKAEHGDDIVPCCGRKMFDLRDEAGYIWLYYNDKTDSTFVKKIKKEGSK